MVFNTASEPTVYTFKEEKKENRPSTLCGTFTAREKKNHARYLGFCRKLKASRKSLYNTSTGQLPARLGSYCHFRELYVRSLEKLQFALVRIGQPSREVGAVPPLSRIPKPKKNVLSNSGNKWHELRRRFGGFFGVLVDLPKTFECSQLDPILCKSSLVYLALVLGFTSSHEKNFFFWKYCYQY